VTAIATTRSALGEAARDARRSWTPTAWLAVAAAGAAALLPFVAPSWVRLDGLAETGYLALAAVGLGFAIGIGGMPSLAQGAFVGVGAVCAAHLAGSGWPGPAAALVGAAVAAIGGIVVGLAVVRFRPVYVAAATWIATWLFALGLDAFPTISGGASGLVVPPRWSPTVHYELALALVAAAMLAYRVLARSSFGLTLQAAAQRPAAATALGVEATRLRLCAFAGAAAVGGLAGGFAVQLLGVADPSSYGPLLSFQLLVAVLVGGAATALGPTVGILVLGGLSLVADLFARLTGSETARFGPMLTALLLLAILALGSDGIVAAAAGRLRSRGRRSEVTPVAPTRTGASLEARGLAKRFGGVVALDSFALELPPGRLLALIGPNGSGKTTALRLLAGIVPPDAGEVHLDGTDVTLEPTARRVRRGLARTLQSNAVFPTLTALENASVGASLRRRYGGPLRTLIGAPKARREARAAQGRALEALRFVGLAERADVVAASLTGAEQRLLMVASALATNPRVLLLDEPSAGAAPQDLDRLTGVLQTLRAEGLAILVVEHNLRLVRSIADEVVVLDAGKRLAAGSADEIAENPAVRAAYFGRADL
jgi:branched-chain amino acid transport system permease protein